MTQAWANSQWQVYTYSADGQRVRRKVNGVETWQVYGMDGELLAEYAANAPFASPQKEYGYRNGELLITASGRTENVAWTNAVGVTVSGNSLTKTASLGWGNAGAASIQTLISGDGFVEFTATVTNTARMGGLSNGDSNQNYTDIDFALFPREDGILYVYEAGVSRGAFGVYSAGDRMRVAVEGGVVKYRKNGTLLYTSTVAPTYPLLIDSALYSLGATLTNAVISGNLSVGGGTEVNWLVADQLGTPRMIIDKTGSLANVKRHDYLPFGEELYATQGLRSIGLGYTSDTVRQKFTSYERDNETELDYAGARYYGTKHGRFTSVDPLLASASTANPQTFNRFTYALNSPTTFTDPSGMLPIQSAPGQFGLSGGETGLKGGLGFMSPGMHTISRWQVTGAPSWDSEGVEDLVGARYVWQRVTFANGPNPNEHPYDPDVRTPWGKDPDNFKRVNFGFGLPGLKLIGGNIGITKDKYGRYYISLGSSVGVSALPVNVSWVTGRTMINDNNVSDKDSVYSVLTGPSSGITFSSGFPQLGVSWSSTMTNFLIKPLPPSNGNTTISGGVGVPQLSYGKEYTFAWPF